MKKRIISFLTSLVMVISLVGVVPSMTVSASGGVYQKFCSQVLSVHPDGSTGASSFSYAGTTTCHALVSWATQVLFGQNIYQGRISNTGSNYTCVYAGTSIWDAISHAKCGDVFKYTNSAGSYAYHSALFIADEGSNAQMYERVHDNFKLTHYNKNNIFGYISSSVKKVYVYHANNYDSVDGPSTPLSAPVLSINKNSFCSNENVSISWPPASGATSYWLHIYKDGYDYINNSIGSALSYSNKFSKGNYTAWVVSMNGTGQEGLSHVDFTVSDTHLYTTTIFSSDCYSKKVCGCGAITEEWNNNYYDGGDIFYARLKSLCNGKYLGISNTTGGTDVDTYGYNVEATSTSNTSLETLWKFEKTSDGYYHISSYKNSYCLDVFLAKDVNCANIQAYSTYSGNNNQQWRLYKNGSYFNIKPKHSNRCLDISSMLTNANLWEYNGTTAQQFIIEKHTHNYTEKITKQPTCTATGEKTLTCSICGETKTETIPATGHSYAETIIAPTLKEQGYTLHKCSVCGDEYKDNYVKPLCETELKYQLANLGDDKWAVRFLLVVDEETVLKAQNASIFLTRNNGANTKAIPFKTAYRKVKAGGKTISAGEGKVFLTAMYNNIPVDEMYNLKATLNIDQDIYYRTITENLSIDKTVDTPTHNTVEDEDIFD